MRKLSADREDSKIEQSPPNYNFLGYHKNSKIAFVVKTIFKIRPL